MSDKQYVSKKRLQRKNEKNGFWKMYKQIFG